MSVNRSLHASRLWLGRMARNAVAWSIATGWARPAANAAYRWLSYRQQERIHARLSRLFYDAGREAPIGEWTLTFCGRRIRVPMHSESGGLDWNVALSMLGHDAEVKLTYDALLKSTLRPDAFVDIGSNYGTHSLLFLVHGVSVLSFEPNSACDDYFRALCAANCVVPSIEPVALGAETGTVSLSYPQHEPWLGRTDGRTDPTNGAETIRTVDVKQNKLDAYLPFFAPGRLLVKIDVEGSEMMVLTGAKRTIMERRPLIVFESWRDGSRMELYTLLKESNYEVAALPWCPPETPRLLDSVAFSQHVSINFIGIPHEGSTGLS